MTILVDASALVAMVTKEEDAEHLIDMLDQHDDRLYCATGAWEATLAIARKRTVPLTEAAAALRSFIFSFGLRIVQIGDDEAELAIEAYRRYGKGTKHPARLNMGDCFAYACAKANGAKLLYKGNDFIFTDIR